MNIDVVTFKDGNAQGSGSQFPSCTGFASDAFPEVLKPTQAEVPDIGVSTKCTQSKAVLLGNKALKINKSHWYALRTAYGKEKKAYEFITEKGTTAFYPTLSTVKIINGKRKTVEESRIPNIFFAYGTEEEIKSFVYDNINLPYLRFYYRHIHFGSKIEKEPLIVPDNQIETLRIICQSDAEDIIVSTDKVQKFQAGQLVRIIDGKFKNVTGIVARYQGQQRVGIVIDGLLTIATAYIPSAFITLVNQK